MKAVTAIITCGNEIAHIEQVLHSVQWCDEILVVDSFSTDGTYQIAQKMATRVWQRVYVSPADQKNWIIPQASHAWILLLDADERVTPALKEEILNLLSQDEVPFMAYKIYRNNFYLGKRIRFSGWQHDAVVRFFHRDHGRYPSQMVHEELECDGPVGALSGRLDHFTYTDKDHFEEKMLRYAKWSALDKEPKTGTLTFFHFYLKPAFRFFKHYILQSGWLDGRAGLHISMINARAVYRRYRFMQQFRKEKAH